MKNYTSESRKQLLNSENLFFGDNYRTYFANKNLGSRNFIL
jgi:hypothetical protein